MRHAHGGRSAERPYFGTLRFQHLHFAAMAVEAQGEGAAIWQAEAYGFFPARRNRLVRLLGTLAEGKAQAVAASHEWHGSGRLQEFESRGDVRRTVLLQKGAGLGVGHISLKVNAFGH